ncbi:MAG: hypothetical protein HC786_01570 [Richelia sp. CSU_2_1]|nr:hypothetical protein [Richelia sp. CSU_2_1]
MEYLKEIIFYLIFKIATMINKIKKVKNYHLLSVLILCLFWGLGFFFFCVVFNNQAMSNISSNKAVQINPIKVNGKPFFPLGMYHTYFQLDLPKKIEAMQDMAAVGFNTIHASCNDINEYNIFLDEAYRLGVYVITEFKGTEPLEVVAKFKDKPAVLGWSIADDVGDHENSYQILELHKKIKAIDPKHFTYISISGWSKKWDDYAHVADLIGGQSYPIGYPFKNRPQNLPNHLIEVNYVFNKGRTAADRSQHPVIANLQTFSWKGSRFPTPSEVHNMTYQALLSGVNGILFYTYEDQENRIKEHPDVWNRLKLVTAQINKMSPVLLQGTLTKLNTKWNDVIANFWTYRNIIYVIVINTSQTETRQVSLSFPVQTKKLAKPLFPDFPSGMIFENGTFSGLIKPEEVHVYQLSQ